MCTLTLPATLFSEGSVLPSFYHEWGRGLKPTQHEQGSLPARLEMGRCQRGGQERDMSVAFVAQGDAILGSQPVSTHGPRLDLVDANGPPD